MPGEVAEGKRGENERDGGAEAGRVRDQVLRSGVHLGKDQAQADGESVVRLQPFHQQTSEKSP